MKTKSSLLGQLDTLLYDVTHAALHVLIACSLLVVAVLLANTILPATLVFTLIMMAVSFLLGRLFGKKP